MRHPFHRVHLWTLLILLIQCVSFYLFRRRLTNAIVAVAVPPLPADWVYPELIPASLWLFAGFNSWFFSKLYGWRKRSEPSKELQKLVPLLEQFIQRVDILNQNVYNMFKWFNPIVKKNGVEFVFDNLGEIKLSEATHLVAATQEEREKASKRLGELQNIEVEM